MMTIDKTVFIIKPDAVKRAIMGRVLLVAEEAGLEVVEMGMGVLHESVWHSFYGEHEGRSFYDELIAFMGSGPVVYGVLKGTNAIDRWRGCLGATNPTKAHVGSLRRLYGTAGPANVAHGSDSPVAAVREAQILGLSPLDD
jgi:nucleoside-diphosphate kinase